MYKKRFLMSFLCLFISSVSLSQSNSVLYKLPPSPPPVDNYACQKSLSGSKKGKLIHEGALYILSKFEYPYGKPKWLSPFAAGQFNTTFSYLAQTQETTAPFTDTRGPYTTVNTGVFHFTQLGHFVYAEVNYFRNIPQNASFVVYVQSGKRIYGCPYTLLSAGKSLK